MPTPKEKKKSPGLVLIGVPFLAYAVYAAAKGHLCLGNDNWDDDVVIRAVEEPGRFWGLVAALAFAGLAFIIVGLTRGGYDDV
jgi:hypothetical protein